jgi:hypothetical protein
MISNTRPIEGLCDVGRSAKAFAMLCKIRFVLLGIWLHRAWVAAVNVLCILHNYLDRKGPFDLDQGNLFAKFLGAVTVIDAAVLGIIVAQNVTVA